MLSLVSPALAASGGSLIKGSGPAVYYLGADGKRYVFPNSRIYSSWYADFSGVVTVSDSALASHTIGGAVTYKPGARMVKLATDPKVYAVDAHGTLRPVATEQVAATLYGADWAKKIDDLSDAYFTSYSVGASISSASAFSPAAVLAAATDIGTDRGIVAAGAQVGAAPDLTKLALGDGKHATSAQRGYIYSCQTSFNGSGAFADGPWISGSTWDATKKSTVDGHVSWPNAAVSIAVSGANRMITSNALPKTHATGTYPIASSDDAYSYDRNPNSIKAQSLSVTLPANPTVAASPTCVGGEVGISVTGVPIFDGFDAGGRDAVAHEVQDSCDGHPQESGEYHYHGPSSCVAQGDGELFGYAYDGFGIYSNLENGKYLTNADLDECHGTTSAVLWDGKMTVMYHYVLTREFPYTVGCFKGKSYWTGPSAAGQTGGPGGQMGPPPGGAGMGFPPPMF
jgi:hypothetical protein